MMTHEKRIENIEKKSYLINRYQIVTWGLILLSAGFTANKITSNVATKADIQIVVDKIDRQNTAFDTHIIDYNNYRATTKNSLDAINLHIDKSDKQLNFILARKSRILAVFP